MQHTPLDAEGTVLCEKRGYVRDDGKSAFDWEDREVARRNEKEKEKEILLVKCSCQKKKCSERSITANAEKALFVVVLLAHV